MKRTAKIIEAEIDVLDAKLTALMSEDRTSYAQGIIDKLFGEFKAGARWIASMKKNAETKFYVYSPIGRKRNLPAAMTEDRAIVAQQVRRGSNAPVQGLASEVGVKASRVVMESYYKELPILKEMLGIETSTWELRALFNRIVHDASYFSVPFALVIPFLHILQYEATYGIVKRYKDEFGLEFTIEPEIEVEFSGRDDHSYKWDWSLPNAVEAITKAIDDIIELKLLDANEREDVLRTIFEAWHNKKVRHYLQEHYPLLDVPNLDKQILGAITNIYK